MSAEVQAPNGKVRRVKNLRWFFEKARSTIISNFEMVRYRDASGWNMYVVFGDGYRYRSDYASLEVFEDVMGRQRSLKGVPVEVHDHRHGSDVSYSITLGQPVKRG